MLEFDGEKLKQVRKDKKLKQKDVAVVVGKQLSHISNYENGVASPNADTLLNLMDYLNVAPAQIATIKTK